MAKFKITLPGSPEITVDGDQLHVDGMGTRVTDAEGKVVFSHPSQLPAYRDGSVTKPQPGGSSGETQQ